MPTHRRHSMPNQPIFPADDDVTQQDGRRSAQALIAAHTLMAIPHFQRGLVWEANSVALLLESLFYGTPCGSITLWTPPDEVAAEGVALGSQPRFLIIDGQQRIRSLSGVFTDTDDEQAAPDGDQLGEGALALIDSSPLSDLEDKAMAKAWCLNLGAIPAFESQFPTTRRFQLFRHVRDPRIPGQVSPVQDRAALLPLKWFLAQEPDRLDPELTEPAIRAAVSAVVSNPNCMAHLRAMLKQPVFDVRVLGSGYSRHDVISIYNRINSAGKRVEAEERAFATLSLSGATIHEELTRFFDALAEGNESAARTKGSGLRRDDLLTRQKENRFGFKLFMRATVIALCYHSNRSLGSTSFSFDAVSEGAFRGREASLSVVAGDATRVLRDTASLIRNAILCDDFRMLPETHSLWPFFYLLLRFPHLMEVAKPTLTSLLLRLIFADLNMKTILDLCSAIDRAPDSNTALGSVESLPELGQAAIAKSIHDGVKRADSLTSRYTLLLYSLIRRNQARDFSYKHNACQPSALIDKYGSFEPLVAERLEPERQHIVPYSHLKTLYGLKGSRGGGHVANAIGNITFISKDLNRYELGVGSQPLALAKEDPDNLAAHLIEPAMIPSYESAISNSAGAKDGFLHFSEQRREMIIKAFQHWDVVLRQAVGPRPDAFYPVARHLEPDRFDDIRALGLSRPATDALVALAGHPRVKRAPPSKAVDYKVSLSLKTQSDAGGSKSLFRIDFADRNRLQLKLGRSLAETFAGVIQSVAVRKTKKHKEILSIDDPNDIEKTLRWLQAQCGGEERH